MNPASETKFIVGCIAAISLACAAIGGFLLLKGYQSGELLISVTSAGAGGLVGMLSMQRRNQPGDVTVTPPAVISTSPTPEPPKP